MAIIIGFRVSMIINQQNVCSFRQCFFLKQTNKLNSYYLDSLESIVNIHDTIMIVTTIHHIS